LSPGQRAPALRSAALPMRIRRVRLGRRRSLLLDAGAVAKRHVVASIHDAPLLRPRADGEDHARAVSGPDEAVLRSLRAMHEVPRPQLPLLALDEQEALTREIGRAHVRTT